LGVGYSTLLGRRCRFLATHLLRTAHGLTGSAVLFGAVYLLAPGLVEVVLVAALLKNRLWAYPWTIAFLGVFLVYQLYRLSLKPSVGLTALTIFDAIIAWLTYREYRRALPVVTTVGTLPPVAAQAGRLPLLATGDAGELVGVDVVQHHADPAQPLGRLLGRPDALVLGHQAVVMM
jgi:hypothetical protein